MSEPKYKVGDKVRIKSIDWYNENKNKYGNINCGYMPFTSDMTIYCGAVLTICDIRDEFSYYHMEKCEYMFMDYMIECKVGEENTLKTQSDNMETETHRGYYTTDPETTSEGKKVAWFTFWDNDFADKVELDLSDRELIQEDGKWFVVKKKKKYPKTYEECLEVLGFDITRKVKDAPIFDYDDDIIALQRLKRCRDAYWKISGDDMGLGKPWEPTMETVYCISRNDNVMKCSYRGGKSNILEFPTPEMRDTFYENFKEEIEKCKELL